MKFAKTLENTATELPLEWRPYLLKYKPLKKCINRIVAEMATRGLTCQHSPESGSEAQKVEYLFSGKNYEQWGKGLVRQAKCVCR